MRILFCGDVVGRTGRKAITDYIPTLRKELDLDFVIVNGENSASGFGITEKICDSFVKVGVDVITGGDHIFDQKEVMFFIDKYPKLLRPENLPSRLPGKGFNIFEARGGKKILVIHLHAQLFMKLNVNCPFETADKILAKYILGKDIDAIFVDFHGEATSEKMAMGQFLDGRISSISGTHTHVPTSDVFIMPNGTAYQTDAGMCGDYNSIIGFNKDGSLPGFINKVRREKLEVATNDATLCGLFVETDDKTGLAVRTYPIRRGGQLQPCG